MNKRKAVTAAIVAVLGLLAWAYYSITEQMNNSITLERHARDLLRIYSEMGSCPASFEGKDYWGHAITYFHTADHFVLVSFGKDNKSDGADYAALLGSGRPSHSKTNCLTPCRDTVFVDGAVWEACLK